MIDRCSVFHSRRRSVTARHIQYSSYPVFCTVAQLKRTLEYHRDILTQFRLLRHGTHFSQDS